MSSPSQVVDAVGAAVDTAAALPVPDSLQAPIDHLQKLVSTLVQKMQDQEDAFDLERLTWEAGEEHHDEEDADTPLRTATAPATPVRPALPSTSMSIFQGLTLSWAAHLRRLAWPLRRVGAPPAGLPTQAGGQAEVSRIRGRNPPIHGPLGTPACTGQICAGGGVSLRHRDTHPVSRLLPRPSRGPVAPTRMTVGATEVGIG